MIACAPGFRPARELALTQLSCAQDQVAFEEQCIALFKSCDIENGTGTQEFLEGDYGTCQVTSCNSNYSQDGNSCVVTQRSCTITNGTGIQIYSNGAYGACQVASCNSNYSRSGNSCVATQRACSIANGTGTQTFTNGDYGTCQVTSCNSNYSQDGNSCVVTQRSCTITNGTGIQIYSNGAYGACQATGCNPGYTVINNSCEYVGTPNSNGLNAQIAAREPFLDYLIQNVCVDSHNQIIPGDPAICGNHRDIRIGERVPYLITDRDSASGNICYQALFSYPVVGTDGALKVMVAKNMQTNFNSGFRFDFNPRRDGYDLIDAGGTFASGVRTSDGGCFDQLISHNYGQPLNGWIFFPRDLSSGSMNHNILIQRISPDLPPNCAPVSQDTSNSTRDIWNAPTPIGFESGKILNSVVTYHFAHYNLSQSNNALERYYFTREYGFTRWEAWVPHSRCLAEHGNVSYCHPNAADNFLRGRCNPSTGYADWGGQTWVRVDCRDSTFYTPVQTPVLPLVSPMGQSNGVVSVTY